MPVSPEDYNKTVEMMKSMSTALLLDSLTAMRENMAACVAMAGLDATTSLGIMLEAEIHRRIVFEIDVVEDGE